MSELQPQERDQESYAQKGGCEEVYYCQKMGADGYMRYESVSCVPGYQCVRKRMQEKGYTGTYETSPCPAGY